MTTKSAGLLITTAAILTGLAATSAPAQTQNEIQKLLASDGAAFDEFGGAVAVDGDTAVIGARLDDVNGFDAGSAYVFVRGGNGVWTEQQKLTASDAAGSDFFGMRVAVDGDTVVIGAEADDDDGGSSGSAYVFTRTAGVWTEQQKLTASDAAAGDWFGSSVAVHGDTVVIGAERDDDNGSNSGSVYVFTRSGDVWTEQQKLTASDGAGSDFFGDPVAIDGNTIVVGARFGDVSNLFVESDFGAAYVFVNDGGWSEQQKLLASDGAKEDQFGISVAIQGDTVVVGAHLDGDNGAESGSAYVFTRNGGVWAEQQKLTPSDGAAGHEFGRSVAVAGDTATIASWQDDQNGDESGSAYRFIRSAGTWTEQDKLIASDAAAFDEFGYSVAMDGDSIVIGATRDDDNGSASGSAYVFDSAGGAGAGGVFLDLESLTDVDESGAVDAAVLVAARPSAQGLSAAPGGNKVYVKDGSTGNAITDFTVFDDSWTALDMAVTPGGANSLIGVLAQSDDDLVSVAIHRAADGVLVREIAFFGRKWVPSGLVYVANADGPGGSAFGVVAKHRDDNRVAVQLRRRSDGSLINTTTYFRNTWEPVDLSTLADISGNSRPEVVLLGRSSLGQIVAIVKDASTKEVVNKISYLGKTTTPRAITAIGDIGSGMAPELAVLGERPDGRNIVQNRDALDDERVSNVFFSNARWDAIDVGGLADVNGNSTSDLAVLVQHESTNAIQSEVRDAFDGELIRTVSYLGASWDARAFAVFDDINGNGVQELGIVAVQEDGDIRVQIKDALSGATIRTFDIP